MSEPEGSLAQSQERGSRRICFGRGKKSSSERLKRPNGVEVDGRRLQALDIMPGKAAARESPDLRERESDVPQEAEDVFCETES